MGTGDTSPLFPWAQFALIQQATSERVGFNITSRWSGVTTTSSEDIEGSESQGLPGSAKLVMVLQTIIIVFLTFWVYQEYLNNLYLQDYLNGYVQTNGLTIAVLGSVGVFVTVSVGLYARLRHTRRQLDKAVTAEEAQGRSITGGLLEPHVEQHLIEMMRKTTPSTTSSDTGGLPVLKREEPQHT